MVSSVRVVKSLKHQVCIFFALRLLAKNAFLTKFRSNLFHEKMRNFREIRNAKISRKNHIRKFVLNIAFKTCIYFLEGGGVTAPLPCCT